MLMRHSNAINKTLKNSNFSSHSGIQLATRDSRIIEIKVREMIKEVDPKQAYDILENTENAVLIDVRSTMEYQFVGHPLNSTHIPLKEPPDWETKSGFVENVEAALQQQFTEKQELSDLPLLMLCRSGARSEAAGDLLISAGYTNVYNVLEGFEGDKDENGHRNTISGWRFHNLPWEQS